MVGLVLYISSINDELLNRTKDAETYFSYKYGWSFAFAAISFLLTEVNPFHQAGWGAGPCPGSARGGRHFIHILDRPTLLPSPPQNVPLLPSCVCPIRGVPGPCSCPRIHFSPHSSCCHSSVLCKHSWEQGQAPSSEPASAFSSL